MKKLGAILKNKEIMGRIMFTILILFVFRIGAQITVPGVTISSELNEYLSSNNALALMNILVRNTPNVLYIRVRRFPLHYRSNYRLSSFNGCLTSLD